MANLELIIIGLVAVLLVVAAVIDGATRIIPNWLNLAIALLAIPFWWATHLGLWPGVAIQFAIATAAFAVFALFFAIGQMGGGDLKLIVALALILPPDASVLTLWGFAIVGGLMTFAFYLHWLRRPPGTPFENPYGIAIALGALLALGDRQGLVDARGVLRMLVWPTFAICLVGLAWRLVTRVRRATQERNIRTIS